MHPSSEKEWRWVKSQLNNIGLERLWVHKDYPTKYAVSLDNRTYHRFYEVPPERVAAWKKFFGVK